MLAVAFIIVNANWVMMSEKASAPVFLRRTISATAKPLSEDPSAAASDNNDSDMTSHSTPEGEPMKRSRKRSPGTPGTNVHSACAGISVHNALLKLGTPPPDARIGSKHLPWLRLSEWEIMNLRKKMKKNAKWHPSDDMVRRELVAAGRGPRNYAMARDRHLQHGATFIDEDNSEKDALDRQFDPSNLDNLEPNQGMKLNEAKKRKREALSGSNGRPLNEMKRHHGLATRSSSRETQTEQDLERIVGEDDRNDDAGLSHTKPPEKPGKTRTTNKEALVIFAEIVKDYEEKKRLGDDAMVIVMQGHAGEAYLIALKEHLKEEEAFLSSSKAPTCPTPLSRRKTDYARLKALVKDLSPDLPDFMERILLILEATSLYPETEQLVHFDKAEPTKTSDGTHRLINMESWLPKGIPKRAGKEIQLPPYPEWPSVKEYAGHLDALKRVHEQAQHADVIDLDNYPSSVTNGSSGPRSESPNNPSEYEDSSPGESVSARNMTEQERHSLRSRTQKTSEKTSTQLQPSRLNRPTNSGTKHPSLSVAGISKDASPTMATLDRTSSLNSSSASATTSPNTVIGASDDLSSATSLSNEARPPKALRFMSQIPKTQPPPFNLKKQGQGEKVNKTIQNKAPPKAAGRSAFKHQRLADFMIHGKFT